MKFLFIKLKHIGDSLLLTPAVHAVRQAYPNSVIWVVVRKGCEGILAGCSDIDQVLTAAAPEKERRSLWNWWTDLVLAASIRREHFDYAFELGDGDRGRWLTLLCGARRRCANAAGKPLHWWWRKTFTHFSDFYWYASHQVEKDFFTVSDCLPSPFPGSPSRLCFSPEHTEEWPQTSCLKEFAVLHPGTRWERKRWPQERWEALCIQLLERLPSIVISAGPDLGEVCLAEKLRAIDPKRILSTSGRASWAQLAGLLYKAKLFVGVDTAAMHMAAACSCPVVALFMGSSPVEWAPWKSRHVVVQPEAKGEAAEGRPAGRISVEHVVQACDTMLGRLPGP
ncbi:MAG TPA: glycosyltransferase family 9 protein [Desulfonatronum sp.]|nr:glycosyltransferase family 9 protein [Desulfonatronum sp.]